MKKRALILMSLCLMGTLSSFAEQLSTVSESVPNCCPDGHCSSGIPRCNAFNQVKNPIARKETNPEKPIPASGTTDIAK